MIGKTLAHYEIRALLGEGGMGQVYRALDTKLDREVALKLLPPQLAEDPERLARLRREARTLASIHHPRVASLFGLEEADGATFLVMELVEGPTLAELLQGGALRRDDAIRFALQIAEGLEEAHGKGVVHRDLKPANIKVAPGDQIKILDFGLARAYAGDPDSEDLANSPTITAAMTQAGVILGTAAYMSPEQAKGKAVDTRSDIWSYGVILFELLYGRQLFEGETLSETMAEVLKGEIEFERLPKDTPRWLVLLLERCLDRDPATRLQSIGEARIALLRGPQVADEETTDVAGPEPGRRRNLLPVAAVLLVLAAAVVWFGLRDTAPEAPTLRFQLTNPHAANLRQGAGRHVAISPDGMRVATVGAWRGETSLYLRELDSFEWKRIQGTEEVGGPEFSPDGRWLAFIDTRTVYKVNLNGGAPIKLSEMAGVGFGVHWAHDGYLYGAFGNEFWRVSPDGGERETVFVIEDESIGSIGSPRVLPGGNALLFHTGGEGSDLTRLLAADLRTGKIVELGMMGTDPRFVAPGAIVFAQSGQVMAAGFDPETLELSGSPVPVLGRVWFEEDLMHLDISENGTVAYLPELGEHKPELLVVDQQGNATDLIDSELPFRSMSDPRFSPDGRRLVVSANRLELWMIELDTETPTLLSESGFYPQWSRDGRTMIYGSARNRNYDLYRVPIDLSRPEELLLDHENPLRTADMDPSGTLIFREEIPGKGMDLRTWSDLDDPETIAPLMEGTDDELSATVSPDGRWMAFLSGLSGRDEIYVTSYPRTSGRTQISSGGGIGPCWSEDGTKLYYGSGDAIIEATLETTPELRVLGRKELFNGPYLQYRWYRQYDLTPDGEHFVMILNPPRGNIEVITNWFAELERILEDGR